MSVGSARFRNRRRARNKKAGAAGERASFHDILTLAMRYRLRFLLALLGPPAIAAVLIYVLPPVYRAQTRLVVGIGSGYLEQGDSNPLRMPKVATTQELINTEIELLSNPAVVESTITRIGLANLYPELSNAQMGPQLARDNAARSFEASLKVEPLKQSNVIRVTFDHANAQTAARTLDQFIASYQDLHAKVFADRRAANYEERIERDTKELEKLETTRAETKAAYGVFDLAQQRTTLIQQRVEAEKQLRQTADRADALTARLAYLTQTRPGMPSELMSSQTESNPAALRAAEVLMDMRQKEAAAVSVYDPQSPVVKRLRQQTEAAQRQLAETRSTNTRIAVTPSPVTAGMDQDLLASQTELAPLRAQEQLKRVLIAVIGQKMQNLEQADVQIRSLDAQITALRGELASVTQMYETARSADAKQRAMLASDVQTSQAAVPSRPIEPDKLRLLVGGILAGLSAAYGVLYFAASAIRKSQSTSSFGLLLGLPVAGSMPVRANSHQWIK